MKAARRLVRGEFGVAESADPADGFRSVDRLKIDRSVVRDIPQDSNDVALARAIVALARSLNLGVVAEGVETEAQKSLLTSTGCDEMQGFLYSAPTTASDLESRVIGTTRPACAND